MKGVILMGGSGSRLSPLNRVCNKHLINVGGKPMAQWGVDKFIEADITDILIITGKEHMGSVVSYFGSGAEFGCKFTYKVQDAAGGIAQALQLVDGFVEHNEQFFTILGDNIFEDRLPVSHMSDSTRILLTSKKVKDPERFGVIDPKDMSIIEKPTTPPSNEAVCGIYGYKYDTFFRDILFGLNPSQRGEIEVTDLNNAIISDTVSGDSVIVPLQGYWTDAGTHESLKLANKFTYG